MSATLRIPFCASGRFESRRGPATLAPTEPEMSMNAINPEIASTITVNGIQTNYHDQGSGFPVLMITGPVPASAPGRIGVWRCPIWRHAAGIGPRRAVAVGRLPGDGCQLNGMPPESNSIVLHFGAATFRHHPRQHRRPPINETISGSDATERASSKCKAAESSAEGFIVEPYSG